jgi:transposase
MGAVCISPRKRKIKLCLPSYDDTLTGKEVVAFLEHLRRCVPGPIVMVWDKHPIHGRRSVKDFLTAHPRLHVYDLPTAAPELNPTEFVWTQVTEYTAGSAPHNGLELRTMVMAGVARTRRSSRRLWAAVFASDLPWKR